MAVTQQETTSSMKIWFLDSRCSNQMCGYKEWLFDLKEEFRASVKLGDNSRMMAI
jgi:hypothetical protein